MKVNYNQYRFSKKELLFNLGIYFLLITVVSILFYDLWIPILLLLPGIIPYLKERRKELIRKQKRELEVQFLSAIQAVIGALTAGYSIENSFREALKEIRTIYQESDLIVLELQYIDAQLQVNRNIEELLLDLADRSGVEDIQNFGEILSAAKRTGGDLISIIKNTSFCMTQKQECKLEIATCLSGKRMEQGIMSMVPFFILCYVRIASPGFMDVMYHDSVGVLIMTTCLMVYLGSYLMGKKIVNIEV